MALPDLSKLKRYVALVIKFDPLTGRRAGGIEIPRDKGLFCLPQWQNLEEGIEMRLVLDDRDLRQYEGVEGVEVVIGRVEINKRVKALFKPRYAVASPELLASSIAVKGIKVDDIDPSAPVEEQLKILFNRGALGIRKEEPFLFPLEGESNE